MLFMLLALMASSSVSNSDTNNATIRTATTTKTSLLDGFGSDSLNYSNLTTKPPTMTTTLMINTNKTCRQLAPKMCHYSEYKHEHSTYTTSLTCFSEFDNKTKAQLNLFKEECWSTLKLSSSLIKEFYLVIKSSAKWPIINESLGIFKVDESLSKNTTVFLVDFKGFDIESTIHLKYLTKLHFLNNLNLYKSNRLVKSCEEFLGSKSNGFIFQSKPKTDMIRDFEIKQVPSKNPVCSLFFRNAQIRHIVFFYIVVSFNSKRIVDFIDPPRRSFQNRSSKYDEYDDLNTNIINLSIRDSYGFDLNSKLLHAKIFASIKYLSFDVRLNSIEVDVFKPFRNLRGIKLDIVFITRVIHRQGIEWIKSINSEIKVDLSNQTDIDRHIGFYLRIDYTLDRLFMLKKNSHFFSEEDFCLFVEFPFHQMVFFNTDSFEKVNQFRAEIPFTCTELWMFQYYRKFLNKSNEFTANKLNSANFTACLFQERKNLCSKSLFQFNTNKSMEQKFTLLDFLYIFEFVTILLSPMLSVSCIYTNTKTVYVILHKKNAKTMRKKHYMYLSAYCLSNVIISFTQILNLMSECQFPFGFFCSSIHKYVFVQYIKIIFGESLNNTCRLFSNFAYFGFSISRLARIGKDHGTLIVFINNLSIKKYIFLSVTISFIMAICKGLQFQINYYFILGNIFPLPIFQFVVTWFNSPGYLVIFVFNVIFNIFNYFVFVFLHLVVDVVLIRKLVRVLREKEEKMREMNRSAKEMDEASKENEESKRRAVLMVVLNSTLNVCTRIPLMLTSVNDLRLLIQRPYERLENEIPEFFRKLNRLNKFESQFSLRFFCSAVKACLVFHLFGNCLFLLSLSTILFFLKHFDKNFKQAYETCFTRNQVEENQAH